jgi:hypothetical protein
VQATPELSRQIDLFLRANKSQNRSAWSNNCVVAIGISLYGIKLEKACHYPHVMSQTEKQQNMVTCKISRGRLYAIGRISLRCAFI